MKLTQWWTVHKPSSHAVAGLTVAATTLYATNPAFHGEVWKLLTATPPWVHDVIVGLVVPSLIYWRTQRSAVAVVEAQSGESGHATASASVTGDAK